MRVLMPLPDRDFDVTEVAVPWRVLRDAGHQVVFATERQGTVPAADPRLLTGVLFGQRPIQARAADTIVARRRDRGQPRVHRGRWPLPVRALAR